MGAAALAVALAGAAIFGAGVAWAELDASAAVDQQVVAASLSDPTGLAAAHRCTGGRGGRQVFVDLSWTPSTSDATDGYDVLRSDAGGPWSSVAVVPGAGTAGWTDASVTFSTSYEYRVLSRRAGWRSPGAQTVAITTPGVLCR